MKPASVKGLSDAPTFRIEEACRLALAAEMTKKC